MRKNVRRIIFLKNNFSGYESVKLGLEAESLVRQVQTRIVLFHEQNLFCVQLYCLDSEQ